MDYQAFSSFFEKYVVPQSLPMVYDMVKDYHVAFQIKRDRVTKNGDYRSPLRPNSQHKITINGGLNVHSFLLTLVHEIAHLHTFSTYGRKVKPHGQEWKNVFRQLAAPLLASGVWPTDVHEALKKYFKNPKASSAGDANLLKVLSRYDLTTDVFLLDLSDNAIFSLETAPHRKFIRKEKRRSRFLCEEIASKKKFAIHGMAKVIELKE